MVIVGESDDGGENGQDFKRHCISEIGDQNRNDASNNQFNAKSSENTFRYVNVD